MRTIYGNVRVQHTSQIKSFETQKKLIIEMYVLLVQLIHERTVIMSSLPHVKSLRDQRIVKLNTNF